MAGTRRCATRTEEKFAALESRKGDVGSRRRSWGGKRVGANLSGAARARPVFGARRDAGPEGGDEGCGGGGDGARVGAERAVTDDGVGGVQDVDDGGEVHVHVHAEVRGR